MEETHYLPANEPDCSSTRRLSDQTLQSKEYLGSHQYKIHFVISFLVNIAFIITIIVLAVFTPWRTKEPSCPESWIGHRGRCYYFSEMEGTWDDGRKNCASYNASLAAIDAPWELDFLMRLKGRSDSWIGLHREDTEEPWKWTNGSLFNNWFNIAADSLCVYLGDDASSSWCETQRRWICRKS